MVELPCSVEACGAAFLAGLFVGWAAFFLSIQFYLDGALNVFAEFSSLILNITLRSHLASC